jgi:hypothetical protein
VNWIPGDVFTRSLVHLLNPQAMPDDDYLQCFRRASFTFDIDTIFSFNDTFNPLVKLFAFFDQISNNKHKFQRSHFPTEKTVARCQTLKRCAPLDTKLIELSRNYWKHCRVLRE